MSSAAVEVTAVPLIFKAVVASKEPKAVVCMFTRESVIPAVEPAPSAKIIVLRPLLTVTLPPEPCVKITS